MKLGSRKSKFYLTILTKVYGQKKNVTNHAGMYIMKTAQTRRVR